MIKYISFFRHPEGADLANVRKYWFDVHAPLVKSSLPGLRRYVINVAEPGPNGEPPPYDGVVELHFDNMDDMRAAFAGSGWQSEVRRSSSVKVIDYNRFVGIYVEEHEIAVSV